jgi:lipopolysaccharide transport system ATP-binding protein
MSKAITVENLSKIYRLGEIGTGTITKDIDRWFKTTVLGKEDPFLKIGESNDRTRKGNGDLVYSLQDVNFEINQGDAVGIIGRNGAGKSTLLKILSRVTTPTTGKINIKGRVASLLEVGTGFHPELTGRENIYLNGAILGMRKREIDRKLDEIIEFSGVERYIDTPVKRYSSGMYVRLAFAVAAHLESEILIVDEVLAVGDAEFQKKCLGKMGDVSKGDGRTILFVSHNITAVNSLCNQTILLEHGKLVLNASTDSVINYYLRTGDRRSNSVYWDCEETSPGNELVRVKSVRIKARDQKITVESPFDIEIDFINNLENEDINLSLHFATIAGEIIFNSISDVATLRLGHCEAICKIPGNLLNDGIYNISIMFVKNSSEIIYNLEDALSVEVFDFRKFTNWHHKWVGYVRPILDFQIKSK